MSNHQIEMRKIKKIFKLYTEGVSKRKISSQLRTSRNTVTKYIVFFQQYKFTYSEIKAMNLEELHLLFHSKEKQKSERLQVLEH